MGNEAFDKLGDDQEEIRRWLAPAKLPIGMSAIEVGGRTARISYEYSSFPLHLRGPAVDDHLIRKEEAKPIIPGNLEAANASTKPLPFRNTIKPPGASKGTPSVRFAISSPSEAIAKPATSSIPKQKSSEKSRTETMADTSVVAKLSSGSGGTLDDAHEAKPVESELDLFRAGSIRTANAPPSAGSPHFAFVSADSPNPTEYGDATTVADDLSNLLEPGQASSAERSTSPSLVGTPRE